MSAENFEFYVERSGRDADGEYFHGGKSSVLPQRAIHELLGEFLAQFTKVNRENGAVWTTWHFNRDTGEGYDYVQVAVKHAKEPSEDQECSSA